MKETDAKHRCVPCSRCNRSIDTCCDLVFTVIASGAQECDSCWQLNLRFDHLVKKDPVKAHNWLRARVDELAGYAPRLQS